MPKKNIVFIMADDMGAWALRCAGNTEIYTPNLDRLAAEGARFENFFCASPVCSPARASLLTGRIPSAHGIHDWLCGGNVDSERFRAQGKENPYGGYADETEPIAYLDGMKAYTDMLAENGYVCALSGKWHMGDSVRPQHSFERWYTIGKGGCYYYHPYIVEDGDIKVRHGEYVTDLITENACKNISELSNGAKPFYLSVHYTAPHSPWSAEHHPKRWIDYYEHCAFDTIPDLPDHPDMTTAPVYNTSARRENLIGYFAAISAMDEGVGRILAALEEKRILDDTLVIFTSDNGMSMGHHGIWGKGNGTFPFNMFDTAVKVPFIMRCPDLIQRRGCVVSALACACDIFPTLADFVGGEAPRDLSGVSFLPALAGAETRSAVAVFDEYGPVRMLRTKEWKYIHTYPYGPHALYDLTNDPGEEHNLYSNAEHEARIVQMRAELDGFFLKYANPALDGVHEGVTGTGQFCLCGGKSTRLSTYAPAPKTAKEL